MSNLANVRRRLAEGTSSWLNYEFQCRRGDLFSEKYLAQPVGQLLTAAFPALTGRRVQAEVNHPVLAPAAKAGRKPQLDFCIFKGSTIAVAVECKWSSRGDLDIADIFWDLIRLELVSYATGADCYFVLAGFRKRLDALFAEPSFSIVGAKGRKRSVLPVDAHPNAQPIRIDDGFFPHHDELYEKMKKYNGMKFPSRVVCSKPHFYPAVGSNMTFQTYVWTVSSRKSAPRFIPK